MNKLSNFSFTNSKNEKEVNDFLNRVNTKAQELNCQIAFEYYSSAEELEDGHGFDDLLQVFNYSCRCDVSYHTVGVKYAKNYIGKDSFDRDVYEDLNGDLFVIKVLSGDGYTLGSMKVCKPSMIFGMDEDFAEDYQYNDEDLKELNILKGFKNAYNKHLGYIAEYMKDFKLVDFQQANYWGHFVDTKGISIFQRFDHEYYSHNVKSGHCHVYVLLTEISNGVYMNEKGMYFKIHRVSGDVESFGSLEFEIVGTQSDL